MTKYVQLRLRTTNEATVSSLVYQQPPFRIIAMIKYDNPGKALI